MKLYFGKNQILCTVTGILGNIRMGRGKNRSHSPPQPIFRTMDLCIYTRLSWNMDFRRYQGVKIMQDARLQTLLQRTTIKLYVHFRLSMAAINSTSTKRNTIGRQLISWRAKLSSQKKNREKQKWWNLKFLTFGISFFEESP